jgi:hypothetical protein
MDKESLAIQASSVVMFNSGSGVALSMKKAFVGVGKVRVWPPEKDSSGRRGRCEKSTAQQGESNCVRYYAPTKKTAS